MIFFYNFFFLFINCFSEPSFILDPVYSNNNINCLNTIYLLNSMHNSNNFIVNNTLYVNIYLNNNKILLNNNNSSGIQLIKLPEFQIGNFYLVLNDQNELGIYTAKNLLVNDIIDYAQIIVNNIICDKYNSFTLNNKSNIDIGSIESSTINITGNENIISTNISTNNINNTITFSSNKSNNININGDINVKGITNFSENFIIFKNITINNILNPNTSTIIKNNTIFEQKIEIYGVSENPIQIELPILDGIINFNNNDCLLNNLNESNSNQFIVLDQDNNIFYNTITLPSNNNTIINSVSDTLIIGNYPTDFLLAPTNISSSGILKMNKVYLKEYRVFSTPSPNFNCNRIQLSSENIDSNFFIKTINNSSQIFINVLHLLSNSSSTFSEKIILTPKNININALDSYNSGNTLGFDSDGLLCLENNSLEQNDLIYKIYIKKKSILNEQYQLLKKYDELKKHKKIEGPNEYQKLKIQIKKELYQIIKELR